MRLAQLSRKLQVKPATLIKFIEKTFDAEINPNPNSRIPDEYLEKIYEVFPKVETKREAKEINQAIAEETIVEEIDIEEVETEVVEEIQTEIEVETEAKTETMSEVVGSEHADETATIKEATDKEEEETVELNIQDGVIRAPKVEVGGVKVIGKIDLPEKPVAVISEEESEENLGETDEVKSDTTDAQAESEVKATPVKSQKPRKKAKKSTPRNQKSEISYEEQRRLNKEAYTEKLKRQREEEKKQAKARYEESMKKKQQVNAPKPKMTKSRAKVIQQKAIIQKRKEEAPKTLWGKFIYWLNN